MRGLAGLDERTCGGDATGVECNRDDREILIL